MNRILPPSRPKRDNQLLANVRERYEIGSKSPCLIFVRGHYLDSMGNRGVNDRNIYDDACYFVSPNLTESWNANTDPSFVTKNGKPLATLNLGKYLFYPSFHRIGKPRQHKALRTYPEGAILECTRNGVASTCSYINIHKGGVNPKSFDVVFSEGCLTIPLTQYDDWQTRVWQEIEVCSQMMGNKTINGKNSKLIDTILIENKLIGGRQFWVDHLGKVI